MAKDVSFVLDTKGGEDILQKMVAPTIKQKADAIAGRARSMAASVSSKPPDIGVATKVGIIRRGYRAIATVTAEGDNKHSNYIGHMVLKKARDAGRD